MRQDTPLATFCHAFEKLDKRCTKTLENLYTDDIEFTDPLHHIEGRDTLMRYYADMLANVQTCHFEVTHRVQEGDTAFVAWTLHLTHPRLARGTPLRITGCSQLAFRGDRICRHRDYFDAGAMLYEHLPLLGRVIRWLKRRVDPTSHSR
ncbi:SnoaL-like protein [Chromohalobacter marismortui]|uniref:SnoaL-like protein n=1 Tax=Chromohalobacter marismortui TaxID=42055 RepID=A0A4R7NFQ3_9GAMM|nr:MULTISPECIES: nuclear transport factor 2 family protein [Chromohalobacter]MCI0511092.1 nuclear transport factor 2 family protein [Chromohalobacter sp.]MCI0593196.1 nuclear transport factor 2 family protein [Chromohalobacter sp.]TDU19119.1 SnoaL-like protein [Chromohalobacter marismortui]